MSHLTVLIVDDDDAFRQAISIFLREQFSIEIREASNYQEALQQLDDLDLLFVDISLPRENRARITLYQKEPRQKKS